MAKAELHPLSDYHLRTGSLDVATTSGTIAYIPIPQSGIVKHITACVQAVQTAQNAFITFFVANVQLQQNGVNVVLNISTSNVIGDAVSIEFDHSTNKVYEAENGDVIADGSVLEIRTNAAGDDGFASFSVTIAR